MERDLQTILFRDNPWIEDPGRLRHWFESHLPETFIRREVPVAAGDRWKESNRAHLIVGPRQAGKSTAVWSHLERVGDPVLFIDCEQRLVQEWCRSAPIFLADLEEVVASPVTLFFEESQHLENAGLFLKGIIDRRVGVPVLVTGSSSFHLGAKVRESLAGRATRDRLFPLSLAEVTQDLESVSGLARTSILEKRFERHNTYGGYPEVWLGESPETQLTDLVEAIILRDASDLHRIARPDAFRRLVRLAAGQVGNLVNLSEWASILGVSRDTVASYLEILEAGHVVVLVPPYAGGRRSELTRAQKVFLVDNGIRNRVMHSFLPIAERVDAGQALENWVFGELLKSVSLETNIHFWRSTSKAEVDFVVDTGLGVVGIEVKAGASARASIPRSARSFIEAYQPRHFLMVGAVCFDSQRLGETEVLWITPVEVASTIRQVALVV